MTPSEKTIPIEKKNISQSIQPAQCTTAKAYFFCFGSPRLGVVLVLYALAIVEYVLYQHHALGWIKPAKEVHFPG